jgi:ribosomal protein L33
VGTSSSERKTVTKKEIKKFDTLIGYLSENSHRISAIREAVGINKDYNFLREIETIETLYEGLLQERKKIKSTFLFASTSGWTVQYFRDKNKYKKGEKFDLQIFLSFVDEDTFG